MIIAHLTSVHPRFDTRIYHKMCQSLTMLSKVYLVCADGKGDELIDNVNIVDLRKSRNRIQRMTLTVNLIYKKAISLDADIYHLHDPELIRIGLKLIKKGKKVIFDAHEDVGATILNKNYIMPLFRKTIYNIYIKYEKFALKKFSGLIAATDHIKKKLIKINPNTVTICNYPIVDELINYNKKIRNKKIEICFIGTINRARGILELIRSLKIVKYDVCLNLAGDFTDEKFYEELKHEPGWKNVNFLGYLNREEIKDILDRSLIGVVNYFPTPNDRYALPIKMFEYMIAGLPIIASDFEEFKLIFDEIKCGLNVDPKDPNKVALAIDYLIENPVQRLVMGKNGKKAILDKYNWDIEKIKLVKFYSTFNSDKRMDFNL